MMRLEPARFKELVQERFEFFSYPFSSFACPSLLLYDVLLLIYNDYTIMITF